MVWRATHQRANSRRKIASDTFPLVSPGLRNFCQWYELQNLKNWKIERDDLFSAQWGRIAIFLILGLNRTKFLFEHKQIKPFPFNLKTHLLVCPYHYTMSKYDNRIWHFKDFAQAFPVSIPITVLFSPTQQTTGQERF